MTTKIEKVKINYEGKQVTARKLIVASEIEIDIDSAWSKVQTSELLIFVTKGQVSFKPTSGQFPAVWKQGDTVSTKMLLYGLIPFGLHTLFFEKIDSANYILQTRERDHAAKIWDHKISMKKQNSTTILYEDEIIIYGRSLTGFITMWAKLFYKHRQRRWQLVASSQT